MPRNRYYSGPVSDHFDGTRFFVPGHPPPISALEFLQWKLSLRAARWPPALAPPPQDRPPARVKAGALRVSCVGHATVLIQTRGLNILVDPVWSQRVSPFNFAGPKRIMPPGIAFDDLPPLDAILLSHNHYDHLDLSTLSALARRGGAPVLTPLGNDTILRRHDPAIRAQTFDWGDSVALSPQVSLHFEPCYHWSARGARDRRMALWCAFVLRTPDGAVYHIADTAYGAGAIFKQARAKHGPIRLAILPIGAYEPRRYMRDQHVNPAEAVQIFEDCGAAFALAHHWGTFQLTDEAQDAPPQALAAALAARAIAPERFAVRRPGEFFDAPAIVPAI